MSTSTLVLDVDTKPAAGQIDLFVGKIGEASTALQALFKGLKVSDLSGFLAIKKELEALKSAAASGAGSASKAMEELVTKTAAANTETTKLAGQLRSTAKVVADINGKTVTVNMAIKGDNVKDVISGAIAKTKELETAALQSGALLSAEVKRRA